MLYGDNYLLLSKAWLNFIRRNNGDTLKAYWAQLSSPGAAIEQLRVLLVLSLMHALSEEGKQWEVEKAGIDWLTSKAFEFDANFVHPLVGRKLLPTLESSTMSTERNAFGLAAHMAALTFSIKSQQHPGALLGALDQLQRQPSAAMFLPGMPSDPFAQIRRAAASAGPQERVQYTMCVCPNGHPKLGTVGNKLASTERCLYCGAMFGGAPTVAVAGILLAQEDTDQTRPGHILGSAAERSKNLYGERDFTSSEFAILRSITHATLLASSIMEPTVCLYPSMLCIYCSYALLSRYQSYLQVYLSIN